MARNSSSVPVVVAELGRPETPAETAARKARDSRLYRQRKTVNNLVFSLIVSLAVVLLIVLVVPRGVDTWGAHTVDVAQAAEGSAPTAGQPLVFPDTPEGWKAKQAELRGASSGDISYWYIGYTTASDQYAAVVQAFTSSGSPVDETWIAQQLEDQTATGTESSGGLDWTVYDHPERNPESSNVVFAMQSTIGDATLLVYGTESPKALRELAERVAASAIAQGAGTTSTATQSGGEEDGAGVAE